MTYATRAVVTVTALTCAMMVPHPISAQQGGCRRASEVLRSGGAPSQRSWAFGRIQSCRESAGEALAAVWDHPSQGDLSDLRAASYRTRDARLTRAVIRVFRDPARSRAERIAAAGVLVSHAVPNVIMYESDFAAAARDDSLGRVTRISVDDSDVRDGSVPVTPAVVSEIREALAAVSQNDAEDPAVRSAARAVEQQIRFHTRR